MILKPTIADLRVWKGIQSLTMLRCVPLEQTAATAVVPHAVGTAISRRAEVESGASPVPEPFVRMGDAEHQAILAGREKRR